MKSITLHGARDNLNADVHKSMSYWPQFMKQLKQFESLLKAQVDFGNFSVFRTLARLRLHLELGTDLSDLN